MRFSNVFTILPVALWLCTIVVSGLPSEPVKIGDGLTVLIDFEKYKQLAIKPSDAVKSNKTNTKLCGNSETEEYQKCGKHCVLACRHDSSASKTTISKKDCVETKCIEGCFCKDGFVRHQNKCIPVTECPIRRNKAIDVMNEMSKPHKNETYTQHSTQNQTQAQILAQRNATQIQFQNQRPKIFGFGFFNRPGCPFGGCTVPVPVQNQGYDETVVRKENKVHSHSENTKERDHRNQHRPLVVHIHSDGTVEGSEGNIISGGKGGTRGAMSNGDDDDNNNNGDVQQQRWDQSNADYPGFGWNGGFPDYGASGFNNFAGNSGNAPGMGNPGVGNFRGQWGFSSAAAGNGGYGVPIPNYNATKRSNTLNFGIYSLTYNPTGTRTLNIFGLGTYTFTPDGTIISSNVGPKIILPFELANPNFGMTHPRPIEYEDDDEQASEEEADEAVPMRPMYQPIRPLKRPSNRPQIQDDNVEYEQVVNKHQVAKPAKQNQDTFVNQQVPYQFQYGIPNFINPNGRPYAQNIGAAVPPGILPFNYFATPSSNFVESSTNKPSKKKQSENRPSSSSGSSKKPPKESNKQTISVQKPILEYEPIANVKPAKKPSKKEKPADSMKPNQIPDQSSFFNFMNGIPGQNYPNQPDFNNGNDFSQQNIQSTGQSSPFSQFNIPFNGQNPNGNPGFPNNFAPFPNIPNQSNIKSVNQPNFNGADGLSSQLGQANGQFNQFNPFNSQFNGQNTNAIRYQSSPNNFNTPDNSDNSFTYPFINRQFNGFNPAFSMS